MNLLSLCDRLIRNFFYLLFFLVPLVFVANTSELFEFNKMMLTYGLTIIIAGAWLAKMVVARKIIYRRTFLEIPLLLYLASHVLSAIFSIDPHISVWGYYSRFHEGLLASISYLLLYFAAVSNLKKEDVRKIIFASFASATIVSIWGALEHFGHSPSCLLVTGKFNDDCWIQDVKSRVFATLGQPNWMAAYLNIVILVALGFLLNLKLKFKILNLKFAAMTMLFVVALWFTKSRSGFAGLGAGLGVLILAIVKINNRIKVIICALALIIGGAIGYHWYQTLPPPSPVISESEAIRKPVWEGAIKIWQRYPIFGSGVETFAYSFYLDRPASKNLDSEWDFLYNKAHNEYLNILATTGTVGFITYSMIVLTFILWIIFNFQFSIFNQLPIFKNLKIKDPIQISNFKFQILGLFAAWISILVTNFFGFSVVIIGIFFFLAPALCEILSSNEEKTPPYEAKITTLKALVIGLIGIIGVIGLLNIYSRWQADKAYTLGKNYDTAAQFITAFDPLSKAVETAPDEPTFRDELSYNEAVLAGVIFDQLHNSTSSALINLSDNEKMKIKIPQLGLSGADLSQQAIENSDIVVATSPNSVPFWKTRVKTFFQLSQIDKKYFDQVVQAISKAAVLAPTDAKVHYNLGWILKRAGKTPEAISALEETVAMKPDYRDARFALGQYYAEIGEMNKARQQMQAILSKIGPDKDAIKWLTDNP